MDDYEKRIREKVWASECLTAGEWVYLVGLFQMAREHDELFAERERLRTALFEARPYAIREWLDALDRAPIEAEFSNVDDMLAWLNDAAPNKS